VNLIIIAPGERLLYNYLIKIINSVVSLETGESRAHHACNSLSHDSKCHHLAAGNRYINLSTTHSKTVGHNGVALYVNVSGCGLLCVCMG
jgi:hypothetical protein